MRYKDKNKMQEIVDAIEHFKLKENIEPTITQIAEAVHMGRSRVHAYLQEMNDSGLISYGYRHFETPKTERISDELNTSAVVGSIKCGDPTTEEENITEYVKLPVAIFGKEELYLLKARGDSMVDAGVEEGDYVVVENNPAAEIGDIVVALDSDNENTLKRFTGIDEKTGLINLKYENEERYPGKTLKLDMMKVQGVAKFVIKKL